MDSIGKYEILEKIGTGGFGTVYKAYDPFIKRFVAIKTCTSDEEEVRKRFFQEAEISGNLQHRNVVTVYDFGTQEGLPYLIQEFLTGEDLDRKIKRKELIPDAEKVLFLVQIARGLEYAHSKGVVHRDIKPANIRILEDGTAKIMDFGIAKLAQRSSGLTQTGMTLGTAAYLAPEQIRGERVDQRTDIFSFGVMAYEMLTGERPFQAEAISGVLYQILNAKPKAVTASWSGCPPDLASVVDRCLEKDPGKRFANCQELLRDLDVVLRRMRVQRRPSDDMMSTAAMRSATTSAMRQVTGEASQPTVATVVTPAASSGEIDLTYHRDPHQRTPRSISTTAAYRDKDVHWGRWAALLVLAVGAGGGWWYYQKTQHPPIVAEGPSSAAALTPTNPPSSAAPAAPVADSPPPPSPPVAPATEEAAPTPATPQESAAAVPASTPPAETAEAKPAPPPPEPEPPKPATLTVARSWSGDMTVTIDGGAARRLDREQKVELKPGNHVLVFEILSQDYSDSAERQITVKAGEKRKIDVPLGRPGQLNVQAQISSPQGLVKVKGENWGQSPIRGRKLPPGTYRIEIVPLQDAGAPPVSVEVEITSNVGTTVTFNLARPEQPPQVHQSNITG